MSNKVFKNKWPSSSVVQTDQLVCFFFFSPFYTCVSFCDVLTIVFCSLIPLTVFPPPLSPLLIAFHQVYLLFLSRQECHPPVNKCFVSLVKGLLPRGA